MSENALVPSQVDDLETFKEEGVELSPDYWTPTEEGESRRAYFMGVATRMFPDHNDPDTYVQLPCAMFCRKVGGVVEVFAPDERRDLLEKGPPGIEVTRHRACLDH
ncbi:MAG: hypothetical protein ACPG77_10090, partial [Nannocystaceae bacterium]